MLKVQYKGTHGKPARLVSSAGRNPKRKKLATIRQENGSPGHGEAGLGRVHLAT